MSNVPPDPEIVAYWTCENASCPQFGIYKWANYDFPEVKCGKCQQQCLHHELTEPMPHSQFVEFAAQEQSK